MAETFGHLLIGPPGSGKSTLAGELHRSLPGSVVISTDAIRARLYGDEREQGRWGEVEAELLEQVRQAAAAGLSVIYDATNTRRPRRMALLEQLSDCAPALDWCAWSLSTPLKTCQSWNLLRERTVPEAVISRMKEELDDWPPLVAEGFALVISLKPAGVPDLGAFCREKLAGLQASIRGSRVRHHKALQDVNRLHRYSRLADFERLLHLISLLLRYPGLGNLQTDYPEQLARLLRTPTAPSFVNEEDEIAAVMAVQVDPYYARPAELRRDLDWLQQESFIPSKDSSLGAEYCNELLDVPELTGPPLKSPHSWSVDVPFHRLLRMVRWLAYHPLAQSPEEGEVLDQLTRQLVDAGVLSLETSALKSGGRRADRDPIETLRDLIRKDFQRVLRPYGLFPRERMQDGYFVGEALVSSEDLISLYTTMRSRSDSLDDPLATEVLARIGDRLRRSGRQVDSLQPVRVISHQPIVANKFLSEQCLAQPPMARKLEQFIRDQQLIEVYRGKDAPQHATGSPLAVQGDADSGPRLIWPLQILFHNIAWYLGYEVADGPRMGLLAYTRLDRLFLGRVTEIRRALADWRRVCDQLNQLRRTGAGLYLGRSPEDQQLWLSQDRQQVQVTVELWFTEKTYGFVSEGSQRFPIGQVRMNYPEGWKNKSKKKSQDKPYGLSPYSDSPTHRFRYQVDLPRWYIKEYDFQRWIIGFGSEVYVHAPEELRRWLCKHCRSSLALYPALES